MTDQFDPSYFNPEVFYKWDDYDDELYWEPNTCENEDGEARTDTWSDDDGWPIERWDIYFILSGQ